MVLAASVRGRTCPTVSVTETARPRWAGSQCARRCRCTLASQAKSRRELQTTPRQPPPTSAAGPPCRSFFSRGNGYGIIYTYDPSLWPGVGALHFREALSCPLFSSFLLAALPCIWLSRCRGGAAAPRRGSRKPLSMTRNQAMCWLFIKLPLTLTNSIVSGTRQVLREDIAKARGVLIFSFRQKGTSLGTGQDQVGFPRKATNPSPLAFEHVKAFAWFAAS